MSFDVALTPPHRAQAVEWLHHWHSDAGEPTLSLARLEQGYLLRFPWLADFVLDDQGRRAQVWPQPGVSRDTVRHLLLDQVLPHALAQQGRLVLHAAAALVGEWAVAWVGPTGAGKSTLAASFHLAGCPLLSDDGLLLNVTVQRAEVTAVGTYAGLRLWPQSLEGLFETPPPSVALESYSTKRRLLLRPQQQSASPPQAKPLAAVFVLAASEQEATVQATRISACEGCMALVSNAFLLDVADRRRSVALLDAAAACAERVPIFRLSYPRRFSALPQVHTAILDALCTIKPR
ncbi:MAG: hypothetical protein RMN53_14775 [Anaerolineae bacterium]|nr:hypothetical protein [Anaerolineae bacterium]